MQIIRLGEIFIKRWNDDYCETIFPDGLSCPAQFIENEETLATASSLGYTDVRMMHWEHELSHTFISQWRGLPWSPVLRRVAEKLPWSYSQERSDEEAIILAFQRYLNTSHEDEWLLYISNFRDAAAKFKREFR